MSQLWDALRRAAEDSGYELVDHEYRDTDPEACEEHVVWFRVLRREVAPHERA